MIESKNNLEEQRSKLKLTMMAGFREIPKVNIPEIPKVRTLFDGTKNDYWYSVEIPYLPLTACVYELDTDCEFPPHMHELNTEQMIPLTVGAKMQVITDKYNKIVDFPNSIFIPKKQPHAVINKSGFKIDILVIWSPKMIGWNAEFINKKHP